MCLLHLTELYMPKLFTHCLFTIICLTLMSIVYLVYCKTIVLCKLPFFFFVLHILFLLNVCVTMFLLHTLF